VPQQTNITDVKFKNNTAGTGGGGGVGLLTAAVATAEFWCLLLFAPCPP